jgi:signal peptidase I
MTLIYISLIGIVFFLLNGLIFFALCRTFKGSYVTYGKSLLITLSFWVIIIIIGILLAWAGLGLWGTLINIIIGYFILAYLFRKYFSISWGRSLAIFILQNIIWLLIALLVALPVRLFVIEPFMISGQSMSPHYNQGTYLFVEKFDKSINRDDIIVFRMPNSSTYLIKRAVGLPGEHITVKGGGLYINGTQYNDPNIIGSISGNSDIILSTGEYFVLGDNATQSKEDSTTIGPVNMSQIVGKMIWQ